MVATFENFLRTSPSPLPVFDIPSRSGVWQGLLLRRSESTGETIAIVKVSRKKGRSKLHCMYKYVCVVAGECDLVNYRAIYP